MNTKVIYHFILFLLLLPVISLAFQLKSPDSTKSGLLTYKPFIDSLVEAKLEEYKVPGAVISIVVDSQHIYYNGFGFADLENEIVVDKEKTGFRIASVTKTFTATAALQLAEQGKLDLHQNIRTYLPDDDFSFLKFKPFTIHQLLTHTAGIDLTDTGDAALTPDKVIPLEEMARYHMPAQVHTPGTVHSYSNFAYTLAGYVIQVVSGQKYEAYIQEHILDKLSMVNSSIYQPSPSPIKENLARSYKWDGEQKSLPRDYTNTLPGGGMISTARDMNNYMLMHLNKGKFGDHQILSPKTHDKLTSQQYGSRQTKNGICYSFFERTNHGRRSIQHTGGQLGFLTLMMLMPETGTGIFIAHNNREGAGAFRFEVGNAILDKLIGDKSQKIEIPDPPENFESEAKKYVGVYKQMNYPKSSFEKLGTLMGFYSAEFPVQYDGNGVLTINGEPYIQIDKDLFQLKNEERYWTREFIFNKGEKAQYLFSGITKFERISWYQRTLVKQIIAGSALVLLLLQFLPRPAKWLFRKIRSNASVSNHNTRSLLFEWQYWTGSLFVLGFLGIMINFGIYQGQLSDYGVPMTLKFPLLLNTVAGIAAIISPLALWKIWTSTTYSTRSKVGSTLIVLAIVLVTIVFWDHNIIGFHY